MDTVIESNSVENEPKPELSRAVTSARVKLRRDVDVRFQALQSARRATRARLDSAISRIEEIQPRVLRAARNTLEKADRATEAQLVHVEERVTSWLGPNDPPEERMASS
jgi:hypothetical protein